MTQTFASSYIDSEPGPRSDEYFSWGDFTKRRMEWLYGLPRAHLAMTGRDAATNADVAAWRALGRRAAA